MVWFRNHFRRANSSRAAYLPMVHDGLRSKNPSKRGVTQIRLVSSGLIQW